MVWSLTPLDVVDFGVGLIWKEKVMFEDIQAWVLNFEPVLQSLNMSYIGNN